MIKKRHILHLELQKIYDVHTQGKASSPQESSSNMKFFPYLRNMLVCPDPDPGPLAGPNSDSNLQTQSTILHVLQRPTYVQYGPI